jgi:hypothetical protein
MWRLERIYKCTFRYFLATVNNIQNAIIKKKNVILSNEIFVLL